MAGNDTLIEFAPAKVNLYLHITGRRPDGYHLLDSLVCFATVGDQVAIRPAQALDLTVSGPFANHVPAGRDNLVLRAVLAAAEAFGRPPAIAVHLDKALPVAAGIGGGSADAAAVLRGLCRLWSEPPDDPRWLEIAATLGADVPVCLMGRPQRVTGIGEGLEPVPSWPNLSAILVNPLVPVPTPPVFKARTGAFTAADPLPQMSLPYDVLIAALIARRNDLTAAAVSLHPIIGTVLDALAALPGCALARMSGSGGTCFGLFADQAQALAAAAHLARARPEWWVMPASFLLAPLPAV